MSKFYASMAVRLFRDLKDIPVDQVYARVNRAEGLSRVPGCVRDVFNEVLGGVNNALRMHSVLGDKFGAMPIHKQLECIILLLLTSYDWREVVLPPKVEEQFPIDYLVQYFLAAASLDNSEELRFWRRLLGLGVAASPVDLDSEAATGFSKDVDRLLENLEDEDED
jgi:hypothetical protein